MGRFPVKWVIRPPQLRRVEVCFNNHGKPV
ncbi:protein of unknown function (plasmid) [Caballeronia sp. S22]